MYSAGSIFKTPKRTQGRIVGTHQRLDRIARHIFGRRLKNVDFPTTKEILHFEGERGPDAIKKKSPGVDDPLHFIQPEQDDGKLIKIILDHQFNLRTALKKGNRERAAFEAAWLAHAVTDGLTPAHHFPWEEAIGELMSENDFFKVFGHPIKGIMHGHNAAETARNNWLYWGANGYMSKHVAFEYGVGLIVSTSTEKSLSPIIQPHELDNINLKAEFYKALDKIYRLDMYGRFRREGWNASLAFDTTEVLVPEIIRLIVIAWASAIPEDKDERH